jgi:hypothetical protein
MAAPAHIARENGRRGGRPKGSPNKATAEVRAIASEYTEEAVRTLATIMRDGSSEQARIMAADKLLDRGHGKATQPVDLTTKGRRIFVPGSELPDFSPSAPQE